MKRSSRQGVGFLRCVISGVGKKESGQKRPGNWDKPPHVHGKASEKADAEKAKLEILLVLETRKVERCDELWRTRRKTGVGEGKLQPVPEDTRTCLHLIRTA